MMRKWDRISLIVVLAMLTVGVVTASEPPEPGASRAQAASAERTGSAMEPNAQSSPALVRESRVRVSALKRQKFSSTSISRPSLPSVGIHSPSQNPQGRPPFVGGYSGPAFLNLSPPARSISANSGPQNSYAQRNPLQQQNSLGLRTDARPSAAIPANPGRTRASVATQLNGSFFSIGSKSTGAINGTYIKAKP